ncbi:hypothetical protein BpHYR1_031929 [Brachionus plicatilis]|uniref:SH3 domain-containing protein n=1 Tax=Brachionus plicatilis TaxID=10195 RepID=A0A3M7QW24_BRAPC|nr:hypothetical protein BpHYR1_031929 [Brachionus plicatilis]
MQKQNSKSNLAKKSCFFLTGCFSTKSRQISKQNNFDYVDLDQLQSELETKPAPPMPIQRSKTTSDIYNFSTNDYEDITANIHSTKIDPFGVEPTVCIQNTNTNNLSQISSINKTLIQKNRIRRQLTSTQLIQQTKSLINSGYYTKMEAISEIEPAESTYSACSSLYSDYSCEDQSSTVFPSSIVTKTRLDSDIYTCDYTYDNSYSTDDYTYQDSPCVQRKVLKCTKAFKSKIPGDLSLSLNESVVLVHDPKTSGQYVLVHSLESKKDGYVPRDCLGLN